jgi:O-antigen/teichoic acid export membrane protein
VTAELTPDQGIGGRVATGLRWKIVSQVLQQGSRTAVAIVVAHLLAPSAFGLAAMALVFSGIATLFSDLALGAALIQRRTITEADRSTVFWTQMAMGALLTTAGIVFAPAAADFFDTPKVAPLFAATATIGVISAFGLTQSALLTRAMDFRGLELRQITATMVAAAAALTLALMGAGAWAIVAQSIVFAAVSSLLVWRLSSWRPTRQFSRESLRDLGPFGLKVVASRVLGYLNLNVDNILIGRYLGATPLGTYTVAYNVMFLPIGRIAQPVQHVLLPAFSKMQDDPLRLGRAWMRGNRLVALISAPAFIGMAVVAPDFVPVVLGQKWHHAVPVLQLLSLAGFAQSFQSLNPAVLQGVGRPGTLLRFMVLATALVIGSFALGLIWGIVGVAGLFAGARFIQLIGYTWLTTHVTGLEKTRVVASFASVVAVAAAVGAAAYLTRLALLHTSASAGVRLALVTLVGMAVYAAIIWIVQRDVLDEVRRIARDRS